MEEEEQHPSDQEIAAIYLANGIEPQNNQPDELYIQRMQRYLRQTGISLTVLQLHHLRQNIVAIRDQIKKKLKVRAVLCGVGHFGKWGYTLAKCISKAKGWNQLVAKTAAYGPSQIAKLSFGRAIASRSMWWITGIIATFEVGIQFRKWYIGQITGKQFWINSGKILAVSAVSVVGGAGGAYAGAALGMAFGGPVGAIIGAIIGGIAGSLATSYGAQQLVEFADNKYQKYTADKLIEESLNFFQLPSKCTLATLERVRKAKFMQYHPDSWVGESEKKQQEMAKKLQQTMEYYEILKNALEAKLEKSQVLSINN